MYAYDLQGRMTVLRLGINEPELYHSYLPFHSTTAKEVDVYKCFSELDDHGGVKSRSIVRIELCNNIDVSAITSYTHKLPPLHKLESTPQCLLMLVNVAPSSQ